MKTKQNENNDTTTVILHTKEFSDSWGITDDPSYLNIYLSLLSTKKTHRENSLWRVTRNIKQKLREHMLKIYTMWNQSNDEFVLDLPLYLPGQVGNCEIQTTN